MSKDELRAQTEQVADSNKTARGQERKGKDGKWRKHGVWLIFTKDRNSHSCEEHFEDGVLLARQPNVEPVLRVLQSGGEPSSQYSTMEQAVGSYFAAVTALRILHADGLGVPSGPLLAYLIEVCPQSEVPIISVLLGELGTSIQPLLMTTAAALLAKGELDQRQQVHSAIVMLALWRIDPALLTPRLDDLVVSALESHSFPHPAEQNGVDLLGQMVATLPEKRAEALLLRKSTYPYFLTVFAWACPTSKVLDALLSTILGWRRGKLDGNPMYRSGVLNSLRRVGRALVAPLLASLAGAGKKAPQREMLLTFLAELRVVEAAPTLVAFLTDPLEVAREAARRGLVRLGEAAWPALEAASEAKKSAGQKAALALLEQQKARVKVEEADWPEGYRVLCKLQSSMTDAERARWLGLFSEREVHWRAEVSSFSALSIFLKSLVSSETRHDLRALLFYSQHYLELCRSGRIFEPNLHWILEECKKHWDDSPAIPYWIASLLIALPGMHGEAFGGYLGPFGQELKAPLEFMLGQRNAEDEEGLRAALSILQ